MKKTQTMFFIIKIAYKQQCKKQTNGMGSYYIPKLKSFQTRKPSKILAFGVTTIAVGVVNNNIIITKHKCVKN